MSRAYYNENEPFAAAWLRELIKARVIAPGDVDERDIRDVRPSDLAGYTQCHFFAGIGVWSYALRRAGWPDDRPVWTGSCPCQPFSAAGRRKGAADERHLWPVFFQLIRECRPALVFGEQVASSDGLAWLSGENAPLQALRDRKAVLGILCELKRQSPLEVQGLRTGFGARQETLGRAENIRAVQGLAGQEAGFRVGECSSAPREETGLAVRPGPEGHPGSDRSGSMRDDGYSVRPDNTASLERSVIGSDSAGTRLHEDERARGVVCLECDGKHMGTESYCGDCECDHCEAESTQRAVASLFDGGLEAPAEWPGVRSVFSDLEAAGYAVGAADTCAAGVGAPHIRQRLYWVADAGRAHGERWPRAEGLACEAAGDRVEGSGDAQSRSTARGLADANGRHAGAEGIQRGGEHGHQPQDGGLAHGMGDTRSAGSGRHTGAVPGAQGEAERCVRRVADESFAAGAVGGLGHAESDRGYGALQPGKREGLPEAVGASSAVRLGNTDDARLEGWRLSAERARELFAGQTGVAGFWSNADWLYCRDDKWRPVEPGTFPLAHGSPARVGRLRGYGNAINAEQARAFIEAYLER